jgi:transcriptional regulator with XRE-family HTH domain
MKWHERARKAAEKKGLSHEGLAEILGKGRSTVSGWFNGIREPKLDEIFSIADALGVTRQWLLFGDGEEGTSEVIKSELVPVPILNGTGKNRYESIYVPATMRGLVAFEINENTGIAAVPVGAIVVVDHKMRPKHNDLVFVETPNGKSVFRLMNVGGYMFFGVDDDRVPLIPVPSPSGISGVVTFISINLKK